MLIDYFLTKASVGHLDGFTIGSGLDTNTLYRIPLLNTTIPSFARACVLHALCFRARAWRAAWGFSERGFACCPKGIKRFHLGCRGEDG